jgi:hypothetical protein|tara:strand:- start:36308 stop:36535 length:228 start_codon:yes stop_codon:yes gene_type:complete
MLDTSLANLSVPLGLNLAIKLLSNESDIESKIIKKENKLEKNKPYNKRKETKEKLNKNNSIKYSKLKLRSQRVLV